MNMAVAVDPTARATSTLPSRFSALKMLTASMHSLNRSKPAHNAAVATGPAAASCRTRHSSHLGRLREVRVFAVAGSAGEAHVVAEIGPVRDHAATAREDRDVAVVAQERGPERER